VVDHQLHLQEKVELAHLEPSVCVQPGASVRQALGLMKQQSAGSCLICAKDKAGTDKAGTDKAGADKLTGIFTERDALKLLASGADLDRPIETVMSRDPATARATDTVASAIEKMSRGGYRRLPVVDAQGQPVGVIGVAGIVHFLVEHFPQTVYNLPPKPNPAMPEREGA
jgi:CBS domain-containing protein